MTSPAPRGPTGLPEPARAAFAALEADPKLGGKGLSEAFARSFPSLPAEVRSLAATEAARVAAILGVPQIAVLDVIQLASSVERQALYNEAPATTRICVSTPYSTHLSLNVIWCASLCRSRSAQPPAALAATEHRCDCCAVWIRLCMVQRERGTLHRAGQAAC